MTMQRVTSTEWQRVKLVPYLPTRGSTPNIHAWVADLETKTIQGEAYFRAALQMKAQGFSPDVIVSQPTWGESLFLKDVWPAAKLGMYCEFFYHAHQADVNFGPEFRSDDPGEVPRMRLRNLNNLLHFESADAGLAPTQWQASTFPEPFRSKITVIHDGIDTHAVAPAPQARVHIERRVPAYSRGRGDHFRQPQSRTLPRLSHLHELITRVAAASAPRAGHHHRRRDTEPVHEAIRDGEAGRLAGFFDVAGLANEVCSLFDDPQGRARMGQAARAFAQAHYDLSTVCLPRQLQWVQAIAR
jgi:glycosyltransferase involved in cell wall biosynthesis